MIKTLRAKCPWDREQQLKDLIRLFIEESYELLDALERGNRDGIEEEIGDLIFLSLMAAVIAEEDLKIEMKSITDKIITKYRNRHPHVFGITILKDSQAILKHWEREKKQPFENIPKSLPALVRARLIQERASRYGFDWKDITGPITKVKEEVDEIVGSNKDKREVEFGDLLFSLVNLARFMKIDPEQALAQTCDKFQKRFNEVLKRIGAEADLAEMDRIWDEIKND